MATKTSGLFAKRLKVTGTGKLMARRPGFNHFNARATGADKLAGKKMKEFTLSNKDRSRFLPHN